MSTGISRPGYGLRRQGKPTSSPYGTTMMAALPRETWCATPAPRARALRSAREPCPPASPRGGHTLGSPSEHTQGYETGHATAPRRGASPVALALVLLVARVVAMRWVRVVDTFRDTGRTTPGPLERASLWSAWWPAWWPAWWRRVATLHLRADSLQLPPSCTISSQTAAALRHLTHHFLRRYGGRQGRSPGHSSASLMQAGDPPGG